MKKSTDEITEYQPFCELFAEYLKNKYVELDSGLYVIADSDFSGEEIELSHCDSFESLNVSHEDVIKGHFKWLANNTELKGNASANTGFFEMAAWLKKKGEDAFEQQNSSNAEENDNENSKILNNEVASSESLKEKPQKDAVGQAQTSEISDSISISELQKFSQYRFCARITKLFATFGVKVPPQTINRFANHGVEKNIEVGEQSKDGNGKKRKKRGEVDMLAWCNDDVKGKKCKESLIAFFQYHMEHPSTDSRTKVMCANNLTMLEINGNRYNNDIKKWANVLYMFQAHNNICGGNDETES